MRARGASLVLALLASSCSGEKVSLGLSRAAAQPPRRDAGPRPDSTPRFAAPEIVSELESESKDDNPTLTADLKEIYFTSKRSGNSDVWVARRASENAPFDPPEQVSAVNSDGFESSPAVDPDGLSLWFGSVRDGGAGGSDIWVSQRASRDDAWATPVLVPELNSSADDIPRPTADAGLRMPLGSRRDGDEYQTYIATRSASGSAFTSPVLLTALALEGSNTADAFLTADGAGILFVHATDDKGDLFFAERTGPLEFGTPSPISSLNTDADERDPWLSPDGTRLYFASDRDGALKIYSAMRIAAEHSKDSGP